ncbi:hypothetical protein HOY80DRAFT_976057, partial [Tuber brumale]
MWWKSCGRHLAHFWSSFAVQRVACWHGIHFLQVACYDGMVTTIHTHYTTCPTSAQNTIMSSPFQRKERTNDSNNNSGLPEKFPSLSFNFWSNHHPPKAHADGVDPAMGCVSDSPLTSSPPRHLNQGPQPFPKTLTAQGVGLDKGRAVAGLLIRGPSTSL